MNSGVWNRYTDEQWLYILRWLMGLAALTACILFLRDYGFELSPRTQKRVEYGYLILGFLFLTISIIQLFIRRNRWVYLWDNKAKYLFSFLILVEILCVYLLRINIDEAGAFQWVKFLTLRNAHIVFFQLYVLSNVIRWIVKVTQFLAQYNASPAWFIILSFGGVILVGAGLLSLPKATSTIFRLTPQAFEKLREEGIPDETLEHLSPLADQKFTDEHNFLNAAVQHIGREPAERYKKLLVKHARFALHPVDALFTATSAVCVTGLIVVDTATAFTPLGQLIILGLIQIGGLGIMTVTAFFTLIVGQRMSGREQVLLGDMLDTQRLAQLGVLIRAIFLTTIAIEACGVWLLYVSWKDYFPSPKQCLYTSLFHSISAFCNAGFSTFSDSLMGFASNMQINVIICTLIILGGLGFGTLRNIGSLKFTRRSREKLDYFSVQSKIVLVMTMALITLGMLLFLVLEHRNTLGEFSFGDKMLGSFFQSVTFRTAGFNTIDFGSAKESTLMVGLVWMFIGAAPGSTGGGIKVTTLAILLGTVIAAARGRTRLELFRRTIPVEVLYQTLVVITMYLAVMMVISFLLSVTEPAIRAIELLFETVSALGTVGLSTGVTSQFSKIGRILIIITMFLGRIGPFTLALAIGQRQRPSERYRYPSAKVQIG